MTRNHEGVYHYTGHTISGLADALKTHGTIDARTGKEDSWNDGLIKRIENLGVLTGQKIVHMKTSSMKGTSMTRFSCRVQDNQSALDSFFHSGDPFEEVNAHDGKDSTTTHSF